MNKKENRGGKRKGAGRPKGSGKGRTVKTSSINLRPDLWAKLDELRRNQSRSKFISEMIENLES